MMNKPGDARLTDEVAREVCIRTNSKALLEGSISSVGTHYMIGLKAVDCQTGDTLASAQTEAENRDNVLKRLGETGDELRRKLGESLISVKRYNKPLQQVTTSSLEALQAYSIGRAMQTLKGDGESIPYHKRAIELDPNFARAYASLGMAQYNLRETSAASENFKKAFQLRDRVSERERFYIEAAYFSFATGELEKANQVYKQWSQEYPSEVAPHVNLALNYEVMGDFDKALQQSQLAVEVSPASVTGYANLFTAYLALDRIDEALAVYQQTRQKGFDNQNLRETRYAIAFLQNDQAEMKRQVQTANEIPGAESALQFVQSDTDAVHGNLTAAREMMQRAVATARREGSREIAALWLANGSLREALFGEAAQAKNLAAQALQISPGRDIRIAVATAFAAIGESGQAQKLSEQLNTESPMDTLVQNYWLPTIRSLLALHKGDAKQAIALLDVTRPYELGIQNTSIMMPIYVRGLAYAKAGQLEGAAAEFGKMLAHRGLGETQPIQVLALLQLARAKAAAGDKPSARRSYQDLLALWRQADPNLSLLHQAQAEYDKLKD
jgi:hypothetical protein